MFRNNPNNYFILLIKDTEKVKQEPIDTCVLFYRLTDLYVKRISTFGTTSDHHHPAFRPHTRTIAHIRRFFFPKFRAAEK